MLRGPRATGTERPVLAGPGWHWSGAADRVHARSMRAIAPEIVELRSQEAVAVHGEVAVEDVPAFFARAYTVATAAVEAAGVEIVGPPFGFYPAIPTDGVVEVEAGFAVSDHVEATGEVHPLSLPGGRAVRAMHVGSYDTMERTYADLRRWMTEHGLRPATRMWECYLSDPVAEPDPTTWRTLIVWPVAG